MVLKKGTLSKENMTSHCLGSKYTTTRMEQFAEISSEYILVNFMECLRC